MKFMDEWKRKSTKGKLWMLAGGLSLSLAVVGLFLPIVPQIPFAIMAAFCFSKGSPKMHKWMRNHKKLGPPIKDWEDHRVLRPKIKVISTVAMIAGGAMAWYKFHEDHQIVAIGICVAFLLATIFVLTRKSHPDTTGGLAHQH